jgi:hypothetical protein
MAWRPSPPELIRRFDAAIPAGVERRKMFGYSAAFLGGRLFAGLHQESVVLRLGPADRAELLAVPGAERFEPMPGRAMGDRARPRACGDAAAEGGEEEGAAETPNANVLESESLRCDRLLPLPRAAREREGARCDLA